MVDKARSIPGDSGRRSSLPIARTLLAVAAAYPDPITVGWRDLDNDRMFDAAEHHRIATFLRPLVEAGGAPPEVSERSRLVEIRRRFAQARMAADLGKIIGAARQLSRPWAVLKGPTLVATAYGGAAREFVDLDVLVDGRELEAMTESLMAAGGTLVDSDFDFLSRIRSGEIGIVMPAGSVVDLHWHPIHSARVRHRFAVPAAELLDRVEPVGLDLATTVPGLEPTDALLYLCLHACLSGGERLLWFKDIDLVARRLPWSEAHLVERARRWRIGAPVALMLERSRRLFGTPIDPALTRRLCKSRALRWTGTALDQWASPQRQLRNSHDRMFFRSVRPTAIGTASEMTKQLVSEAFLPARLDVIRPWRTYTSDPVPATGMDPLIASKRGFFGAVSAEAAGQDSG